MQTQDTDPIEQLLRQCLDGGQVDETLRLGRLLDQHDQERHARISAGRPLGSFARWYAERGIPVFPLRARRKTPATPRGFKDATIDLERIDRWWAQMPYANIGTPTGIRFDVIDIDGLVGIRSLLQTDPAEGRTYYDEIKQLRIGHVLTPRDGGHHIYIPPQGWANGTKRYPGHDYRGKGGYVVLPPSVTDEYGAGRMYRWLHVLDLTKGAQMCRACGERLDPAVADVGLHVNCELREVA